MLIWIRHTNQILMMSILQTEYSDNMSEKEKASSKEKETLKNLMEKSLKKLAKTSSQTNNVNEHFKKEVSKSQTIGYTKQNFTQIRKMLYSFNV